MKKQTRIITVIITLVVVVQVIGFLMSDKGYFFSPTIDILLGGIELLGLGIWVGISIGNRKKEQKAKLV